MKVTVLSGILWPVRWLVIGLDRLVFKHKIQPLCSLAWDAEMGQW